MKEEEEEEEEASFIVKIFFTITDIILGTLSSGLKHGNSRDSGE